MRKRASKLFQGSIDKFKDSLSLSKSGDTGNTPVKKKKKDETTEKKARRGSVRKRVDKDINVIAQKDLKEISSDVENIKIDLMLIMKALQENNIDFVDERLPFVESPDQRMLNKMLEGAFTSLFSTNGKLVETDLVLGTSKPILFREILIPSINLNAVSNEDRELLKTLEFDIFPYKDSDNEVFAFQLLMTMFYEFDLIKIFKIPEVTLYRFLYMISRRYRNVPFHNFYHAFNVTQTLYFFLVQCQIDQVLGPLEILALLIATIVHDCDHPGLNNDFQRKAQTRIYHMHRKSVLENHHYLHCMSMLAQPETNILVNLSEKELAQIYIYLRDLVLATDLAVHGIILKSLKDRNKILSKIIKSGTSNAITEEDRKLIMCALVKCSDLSNEIRKQQMSKKWAKLVIEEFLSQSKKEKEMDLPLTPFMDKEKIIVAKEQMNFIEKLCLPLYIQMAQIFPEIQQCCQTLQENKESWQRRLDLFFTNSKEIMNLPSKSIWERDQVKSKTVNLSTTLAMRATNSVPTLRRSTDITAETQQNEMKKMKTVEAK